MTRFTDSAYERMMTRRPEGGKETSRPPSLPHSHPCYEMRFPPKRLEEIEDDFIE